MNFSETLEKFAIKHETCLFCQKHDRLFQCKLEDGSEIVYCPSCGSKHKTYRIKTYQKGRNFEYQVKKLLQSQGFTVFRCASSKPLDLVAFKLGKVLLVECKTSLNISEKDKEKLGQWSAKLGFPVALFSKGDGDIQVQIFEASQRKPWKNTFQLLEDFIQFLMEKFSQSFPDGDHWVNLSQLDSSQVIWNFLFGSETH